MASDLVLADGFAILENGGSDASAGLSRRTFLDGTGCKSGLFNVRLKTGMLDDASV